MGLKIPCVMIMNNTIKKGDKVRFEEDHGFFLKGELCTVEENTLGSLFIENRFGYCQHVDLWEKVEDQPKETMYKEGDILVHPKGSQRMILGVCGRVYHVSNLGEYDKASNIVYTQKELNEAGWKLLSEAEGEEQKAIELLEKRGRIKEGKIVY